MQSRCSFNGNRLAVIVIGVAAIRALLISAHLLIAHRIFESLTSRLSNRTVIRHSFNRDTAVHYKCAQENKQIKIVKEISHETYHGCNR